MREKSLWLMVALAALFVILFSGCVSPQVSQKGEEGSAEIPRETSPTPPTTPPEQLPVEKPELGIALTFAPDPVVVGEEVTFSIWMSTGNAASGGTVIISIEQATIPMSSMEMTGNMVGAVEEAPGKYKLGVKFDELGDYVIHVHFVPAGRSMMEMMRNHADFGPLRVYSVASVVARTEKVDVGIAANAYLSAQTEGFAPETISVAQGTTITWKNYDVSSHTVTENENTFTSPLINPGESWSYKFDKPGVYRYHCNPHPWMEGTIIVTEIA